MPVPTSPERDAARAGQLPVMWDRAIARRQQIVATCEAIAARYGMRAYDVYAEFIAFWRECVRNRKSATQHGFEELMKQRAAEFAA